MIRKMLLPLLLGISLILTSCGNNTDSSVSDTSSSQSGSAQSKSDIGSHSSKAAGKRAHAESSMKLSLDENGNLSIERPTLIDNTHSSDDQSWSVFVYMCGSNLEDDDGLATNNMLAMLNSETDERVKFIVETGGANEWQNDWCKADAIQRLAIYDGQAEVVDEQPIANMGDSQTLADFLKWGIENYPAENYGLILWNHGGGSLSGVCFDEKYDENSLKLHAIDEALLSVNDMLWRNFEFVGFDACLMGTIEAANMLASHAYYMYGSQEIESGLGWDYEAIGKYLMANPDADGAGLGKAVADSFYAALAASEFDDEDAATMSVIDLSRIDDVVISFNSYTKALYEATEDTGNLSDVIRRVLKVKNYGGNNKSVGYTNMVDLGGLVDSCSDYAGGAASVKAAIDNAVIYDKNGANHTDASGLSVYYPLQIQDSSDLKTFGEVAVSPYYYAYVARMAYAGMNSGDSSGFDDSGILNSWGHNYEDNNDWSYYDSAEPTGESQLITFAQAPELDAEGRYTFTLTQDAIDNASSVQASVYMLTEDQNDAISLGLSSDIAMDWNTGKFTDNFDGYWFSLPDGQNLAVYIMTEGDGYDVYSSPVQVNGEATNLVFTHDYINNTIIIDGIWDGIEASGMAGRVDRGLQNGDRIVPLYDSYDTSTLEDGYFTGIEYLYTDDAQLDFGLLPDGQYIYGFVIDDIYGDYLMTDFVEYTVEGTDVYFNQM